MLLKKAGMVVLAAGAGMVALTPAAFAGDAPQSSDSGHSWGGDDHGGKDHGGKDHGGWGHGHHKHSKGGDGASATNGDCANFGSQLVGVNCTNVQAPINELGVLSQYKNGGHGGHGGSDGASARNGDSANFGDQLIGLNGTNVQAPINKLGILSSFTG
jgi:hypothetical protein